MASYSVDIADMRTRVTFQVPTAVVDAGGSQSVSWANVATNPTVWARWINDHGVEAVQDEALKNVQGASVTVRYRTDILPTWQLLKDGEAWQIISVDAVQDRNRWIELRVQRAKGTV